MGHCLRDCAARYRPADGEESRARPCKSDGNNIIIISFVQLLFSVLYCCDIITIYYNIPTYIVGMGTLAHYNSAAPPSALNRNTSAITAEYYSIILGGIPTRRRNKLTYYTVVHDDLQCVGTQC